MSAKVYSRANKALFDTIVTQIGETLADGLTWLDTVFGICERMKRQTPESRSQYVPVWSRGDNDYIVVMPDDKTLGSHAFFVLSDPMSISDRTGKYTTDFDLIVWGDMRKVSGMDRSLEYAKADVLSVIRSAHPSAGSVQVSDIYDRPDNVYREFTIDETDARYAMQPYFCLRFRGTLTINEICW